MEYIRVTTADNELLEELSSFATAILRDHYDPILGTEQNDYMLDKFQSVSAMDSQLKDGYRYYLVKNGCEYIAFIGFYPRDGKLYLSKFYIHKNSRRKGYATKILQFIMEIAKDENLTSIFLNVNKYNADSIATYEHLGFQIISSEKNDIGNGYYMDDYVMNLTL